MAVAATVVGGWLGQLPAWADPAHPGPAATTPAAPAPAAATGQSAAGPQVWPRPRQLGVQGGFVPVPEEVTLIAGPDADPYALQVVQDVLRAAGARTVTRADAAAGGTGLTVYAGAAADAPLRALGAAPRGDLPSGGYRLATGGRTVALDGAGPDGLFHAAQTLRQLAAVRHGGHGFPAVTVRDWPAAPVRGTAESFYGVPWTQGQRLAQLDFMARTKQNRYLYAPGDDPYRQSRWREPYPAQQRADFRELTARALRDHVTVAWAVAPGQAMCLSSTADQKALERKLDAMWALGIRAFQLQFQDVSYSEWHCAADAARFGTGPDAAARAQAQVANAVAAHLQRRYGDAAPELSLLPTEFYQDGATPYRTALAGALDPDVEVAWTGVGVLPRQITGAQVAGAKAALRHPLLTVDDYPVNDFAPGRLFMGPYQGRQPAVATVSDGLLAAAMQQPAASRVALFTAADFAWNPGGYDPQASWQAAIDDLAGPDPRARAALRALAGNEQSSALGGEESAYLQPLVRDFWAAQDGGAVPSGAVPSGAGQPGAAGAGRAGEAARRLRAAFTVMRTAPDTLGPLAGGTFGGEAGPWLARLAQYGAAGEHAVDMLRAQAAGDGPAVWRARQALDADRAALAQGTAQVGEATLDAFLTRAVDSGDAWLGVRTDGRTATATMASGHGTDPSAMVDGKDTTAWSSDAAPKPDDWFGVDLGGAEPVASVRIAMGDGSGSDDFLHDAVLEVAGDDGTGWRKIGEYHDQATVIAALPAGTRAREVRLRAAAGQDGPVTVREFAVAVAGREPPVATGGAQAAAAVDGDLTTAAGSGPLTVRFAGARLLDTLTVAASPVPRPPAPRPPAAPPPGPPDAAEPPVEAGAHAPAYTGEAGAFPPAGPPDAGPRTSAGGGHAAAAPPEHYVRAYVEVHLVKGGWRRVGRLGADGWTEVPVGALADAVRISDGAGVREVMPWFAGAPQVVLDGTDADAEAGGAPATVTAHVASGLPRDLTATVAAGAAPHGITVGAPGPRTLARGAHAALPLRISVAAGTAPGAYGVPVRFTAGGRTVERRITVHVHPPTGGPDLALGAVATSSGDETPDFPASAVADGDPATRWSSPADDGAWVQVALPAPARIGRVVLDWQDAYAARYTVQTSSDGVTWHTAATVADGNGGREQVWLDDPRPVRFIRMQGVRRATTYGYSLFALEAYATTTP